MRDGKIQSDLLTEHRTIAREALAALPALEEQA
jgi:hypothetical protein